MIGKLFLVMWNAIRFIGLPQYKRLLVVGSTTRVNKSPNAKLKLGCKFRSRNNVEINIRESATLSIGDNVFFNSGCIITARDFISIGDNTIFGPNVVVYDNDHMVKEGKIRDNEYQTDPIKIGKNVWIGAGSIILKGAEIGDDCIIAAGSIVKGKVESGSLFLQKRDTTIRPI